MGWNGEESLLSRGGLEESKPKGPEENREALERSISNWENSLSKGLVARDVVLVRAARW